MPTWPVSLPCDVLADSLTYTPFASSIPVNVEAGPPLSRLRYTGEMGDVTGIVPLRGATQRETLYNFWRDDCVSGTLPFTWINKLTNSAADFMFMTPPMFERRGGALWYASLQLRRMP